MNDRILLAELQALIDNIPPFCQFTAVSSPEQRWVAKGHALLSRYDMTPAIEFKLESGSLTMNILRESTLSKMVSILQRAIADLELRIPRDAGQAYGPGAVYDFYRALKELVESAQNTVFVIDPYLDEDVFHTYITHLARNVTVRILLMQFADQVRTAIEKYVLQHRIRIEVRSSSLLHDRVIFVDDNSCWVVGQSIKDAAKKKPTYIAPLSADAACLKLKHYEGIWNEGEVIYKTT